MHILELKRQLRVHFTRQKSQERDTPALRDRIRSEINRELKRAKLLNDPQQLEAIVEELMSDLFHFGPLQKLLEHPHIAEIMINGPHTIFIEIEGRQQNAGVAFDDEAHLLEIIQRLVRRAEVRLDEAHPVVDGVLDGFRFNIAIAPVAVNGPLVTIRKPRPDVREIEDLIDRGTLTLAMYQFLWACIQARLNIIFSGATGSGKTTLLEVFSQYIGADERVVMIEDTPELTLRQRNVARLMTRPPNLEGRGEITLRSLFKSALRMRPTRIILGELRGEEAFDYLQSINSGHRGSLAVIHASSAEQVNTRLENLAQLTGLNIPAQVLRQQIFTGLDLIVHLERLQDGSRKITEIAELTASVPGELYTRPLFTFEQRGVSPQGGQIIGEHVAHGILPEFFYLFKRLGIALDPTIFGVHQSATGSPAPPPLPR